MHMPGLIPLLILLGLAYLVIRALWPKRAERHAPAPSAASSSAPAEALERAPPPPKIKALSEAETRPRIETFPSVRVVHILDGDTLTAAGEGADFKIRLDSIDCPEDGQPWGDEALAGLIKLVVGRHVRMEAFGEDLYGRTLATLYVRSEEGADWLNVNERMVMRGHAWVMTKYFDHLPADRRRKLLSLQRWARSQRVGLWRTPDPVPPWRWRRETSA